MKPPKPPIWFIYTQHIFYIISNNKVLEKQCMNTFLSVGPVVLHSGSLEYSGPCSHVLDSFPTVLTQVWDYRGF